MKIYRFYIESSKNPNPNHDSGSDSSYSLYAITDRKEYAKEFMKTRNMDVFKYRKDDLEKGVAHDLMEDYRTCYLSSCSFATKFVGEDGMISVIQHPMVATEYEIMVCTSEFDGVINIMHESWWMNKPPIRYFRKDVQKLLKKLEYDKFHKLLASIAESTIINNHYLNDNDDYDAPNMQVDELALFISVFGDML